MPTPKILVEQSGPVTTIVINRPQAKNALDNEAAHGLADAQAELMRWFTEGKLKALVAGKFDLGQWVKAFKLIENRTVVGKAVLVP